ncbi:MAG: TRAP transporter small permease [Thermoleophilia bacterium]|nr:TRAP transporter small permease [Thermoleophilia bacterium]
MRYLGYLDRFNSLVSRAMAVVAGLALVTMMGVTVLDVILRLFFRPLTGTFEIVSWLAALTTAFALGYTQIHRQHVAIDLLVNKLGSRACAYITAAVNVVSMALFLAVAYQIFKYAGSLRASGSLSETMKVVYYPWVYLVAAGCLGLVLALLTEFLHSLRECFPRQKSTW